MRTYHLAATITGTGANQCSVLIQRSGRIKSVRWGIAIDAATDNAALAVELNSGATSQIATHEGPNVIDGVRAHTNFTTSGLTLSSINVQRLLDYPVGQGERIYLHAVVGGTLSAITEAYVDIDER